MLIHELDSRLTREGFLEVDTSRGLFESAARIMPWSRGFDTYEIRHNRAIEQPLWSLQLFHPCADRRPQVVVDRFFSDIPDDIRDRVRRYRFGQCTMLRWLARYPAAQDLCDANPNLFWLLTVALYDSSLDETEIPGLLQQRQTALLDRVIRPARRSLLRLLHRLEIESGDLKEARAVIRALQKPHILKIVAHLESVPTGLLKALCDNPELSWSPVVRLLAEEFKSPQCTPLKMSRHLSDTLEDIRRMGEVLGIHNSDPDIERCNSIEKLERLRDSWVDRVNRRHGLWLRGGDDDWLEDATLRSWLGMSKQEVRQYAEHNWTFPRPPLAETAEIRAIRSVHELIAESRIQKNCVATYAPAIREGEVFIYKVLRPHRATLELKLRGGAWVRGDLRLSCNRIPGPEVERVVSEWFRNAG